MQTIAIVNQKGGVGKSTTAVNLGAGLTRQGKRVLLIDADSQANLTEMLGWQQPDELSPTLATMLERIISDRPIEPRNGILHHKEGMDLLPANIELSGLEVFLVNTMSRETVLRTYLNEIKRQYDYILVDCSPSLGMLTLNALTAADRVIIPVQSHYLPVKGLEQLLRTVSKVQRQLNSNLKISGILITMVDNRTNFAKEISQLVRDTHGFRALYFRYVYLLRGAVKGRGSKKVSRYLWEDTIRFEQYLKQHRFLSEHHIDTATDLQNTKHTLTERLEVALLERKPLYEERRHADETQKQVLSQEISTRTAQIKSLRRELRLCAQIEADSERVHTRVHEATLIQKEERYHEPRQRSRRADDARSHPDFRSGGKVGGAGCEEPCGSVSGTGEREPETARQDPHERPASQR